MKYIFAFFSEIYRKSYLRDNFLRSKFIKTYFRKHSNVLSRSIQYTSIRGWRKNEFWTRRKTYQAVPGSATGKGGVGHGMRVDDLWRTEEFVPAILRTWFMTNYLQLIEWIAQNQQSYWGWRKKQ